MAVTRSCRLLTEMHGFTYAQAIVLTELDRLFIFEGFCKRTVLQLSFIQWDLVTIVLSSG